MRTPSSLSVLTLPLFLAPIAGAVSFDCSKIRIDKKDYNFEKLGGVHAITVEDDSAPPSISNTTWSLDLCRPLTKDKNVDKDHQCPNFTRVCGITKVWDPADDPNAEHAVVRRVIPVAGTRDGGQTSFDPSWKKLDSDEEGVELEFNGGRYGPTKPRKQKAIIHLICDKSVTGNEGSKIQSQGVNSMQKRHAETRDDDDTEDGEKPKQDPNSSLQFISYGPADEKEDLDVLRLDWRTKYACEDYKGDDDDGEGEGGSKSEGWGFFTWFILILFLAIATYLIFGSWLNYNRYGARGWDLLPHGDTIRDLPYLFKDWSRSVVDTVTGGHSRGGYSAV